MSGVKIAIDAPASPQKNAHKYKILGPPSKNHIRNISDKSHI